jgi:predicted nuclease of restriction endonuclease-like (RecB) superfamily
MKADMYHSVGNAITNFEEKLPAIQGRLAQEIVKDTYDFGFVSLPTGYDEEELEDALEQNITRFLLELGSGFAFIGRQKEIIVAGKTRKIDMLFYHIRLRCYVVVELKAVSFEPEFAGKLNFYVNAVNELMKTESDNPTIGLLICKDKDQTEVQWAFQGIETPMGVASYDNVRIKEIKSQLPSEEDIQKRIEQAEEEYILNLKGKKKDSSNS